MPSDYEAELAELEKIKRETEAVFNDLHKSMANFFSTFYQAVGIVPFFEGEDAAILIAMGIAP